ncbi:MAG TPA: RtcB family protein [Candidatus Mediterraneibacter intestinigallinarum]|nr:RtcB family protein [Candidatus Mediterraneibacter intestinigallinarum]
MFEITGKYASAIIYTDLVDQASVRQVMELSSQEFAKGEKIRLMPDIHAGAGRLMSRSEAKNSFSVSEFRKEMDGIYTTSVGRDTLDECPMAYKPLESILENISATVDVKKIIRPIYNFKAGGD